MKNTLKKLSLIILSAILCFAFVSCNKKIDSDYTVGVIQFGSHPSLDNCYDGIMKAMHDSKNYKGSVKIDFQNGNFDSPTCDTIAKNMVSKKCDAIIAIATPAAISAYSATMNTTIPMIFCAVNDPVEAKIVESLENPGEKCTGTSDVLDLSAQLQLIKDLIPNVKKVGVLYTTSEANSISNLNRLTEVAKDFNIEVVSSGIQTAADIPQAATALAAKVDCITNFTDNNVVNNLSVLLGKANEAGIPVFGSEIEQVKNGCLACVGIDYVELGKVTGYMALDIICNKKEIANMPVQKITEVSPVINTDILTQFGFTIPENYKDAETVTTTK